MAAHVYHLSMLCICYFISITHYWLENPTSCPFVLECNHSCLFTRCPRLLLCKKGPNTLGHPYPWVPRPLIQPTTDRKFSNKIVAALNRHKLVSCHFSLKNTICSLTMASIILMTLSIRVPGTVPGKMQLKGILVQKVNWNPCIVFHDRNFSQAFWSTLVYCGNIGYMQTWQRCI